MVCAGGQYLPKMPTKKDDSEFVVSCDKDKNLLAKSASKVGINIQNTEVILTGLLRQKLEFDKHVLIT